MGESVIWLFLKINLSTIPIKKSRRELSTGMVIHWVIFKKNTKLRSFPVFYLHTYNRG